MRIIEKSLLPRIGQRGAGLMVSIFSRSYLYIALQLKKKKMTQPRSLELFEFLGIIDLVMQRSIKPPTARMYKGPEGVEILKEFLMIPDLEPTPDKPYVCEPLNSALVKTIERTN